MMKNRVILVILFCLFALSVPCGASGADDDKVFDLIRRATDDSSFKVRLQAIFMLGSLGDKRAVETLVTLTKDPDYSIRGAAAIALGNIGDVSAIPSLFEMAKDKEVFVKRESVKALKKVVEKEKAVTEVLAYVRRSDERVRAQAIEILGEIKNPAALKAIIQALGDKDEEVAQTAEEAIFKRPQQEVVNVLLQAMYDKTPAVRLRVIFMLGKTQDARAINVLSGILANDVPGKEADAAKRTLIAMSDKISLATTLATLANSPDKNTRNRMLYLLEAKASRPEDKEAVITALRSALINDPDSYIRGRAADTIALLGAHRLIPDILAEMKKPENKPIQKTLQSAIESLSAKKREAEKSK
ncbi:MAG: hypothetical protein Kow0090_07690 [Myxococcota bacterium]